MTKSKQNETIKRTKKKKKKRKEKKKKEKKREYTIKKANIIG